MLATTAKKVIFGCYILRKNSYLTKNILQNKFFMSDVRKPFDFSQPVHPKTLLVKLPSPTTPTLGLEEASVLL